jgi:hypothetical protein
MADMNLTMVRSNRKKDPAADVGGFAAEMEKHANTLADSGWTHEAVHLRKWASELRGRSAKTDYTTDLVPETYR